jgi:hypothetical protein
MSPTRGSPRPKPFSPAKATPTTSPSTASTRRLLRAWPAASARPMTDS